MEKQGQSHFDFRVIVPAAGYGRRVGTPNSKEVLEFKGRPMIDAVLELCQQRNLPVTVVTRLEKTELLQHLEGYKKSSGADIQSLLIPPSREWPETVLLSEEQWGTWNFLLLPDLIFEPHQLIDQMIAKARTLTQPAILFAGQTREDSQLWGCVRFLQQGCEVAEKPKLEAKATGQSPVWCWGVICFHRDCGRELFTGMLESSNDHAWKLINQENFSFDLVEMTDLTR